jgi:outer membrane protein assembly factor BamB
VRINDGVEQKSVELGAYTAASPAVLNGRAYVGTFGNYVLGVDLQEPKIIWKYEDPTKKFPFYSSAAATDQLIAVGGRDKSLHGLEPASGKEKWTFPTKARIDSSPVIAGNRVLFGNVAGEVIAISASTGKEAWKFETGSSILGSPAVASGKLVIGTTDGTVFCFGDKQKS